MPITVEQALAVWGSPTVEDLFYGQVYATYAASVMEARGWGHDAGPVWQTINVAQEIQIRTDPKETFTRAVDLIMLDGGEDPNSQQLVMWLQGNGLQQLTDPRLSPHLNQFLCTPDGNPLLHRLEEFITQPIPYSQIHTKHDLGYFPQCYLTFITVLLASKLPETGGDQTNRLRQIASQLNVTGDFQRIVGLYSTITDTQQFAKQLIIG